ncbi:hypothetical protein BKA61DRAFT_362892 [Leptodontidium sp. MPI-SDFR-AT-0119]|nr:hypothetical protein BKA61DRAFT_362892 [Leptodontidium sp. MPI-SDFR-AT-0119]
MQDAGRESAPANGAPQTEKQDEEHQKASTVIYDITNACFDAFEDLVLSADADSSLEQEQEQALVSDAPSSEEPPRDIRGLRNSFAFWIDYTGALAPVGASLDDRLHSHDDIQEMVVELLEMVEKNLGRLQRNRDENATFPNADSQHWLSAIDSALDRLHFLASAIRQASARRYEQDLLTFAAGGDEFFHAIAISYVKLKCPNARPSLREHMGDSIASRRRAILLKQRHAKKLKTRRAPKPSPALNPEHPLPPSVEKAAAKLPALGGISPGLLSAAGSRATQASKMDRKAALQHINQRPPLSSRSSGSSQQGDSLAAEYPEAPRIEAGEKHVQCPYCLQPLPATEMRKAPKDKYWRRHVDHDLQPYVCLFRRCTSSLFVHESDWRKHMATTHSKDWPRDVHTMTWYCDLGHKEPVEFDNETEWREHMRTLSLHPGHSKPPSDAQLDTLAVRKQQLSPREHYVCPFCEDKPQSIAVLGDRGNPTDMANMLVTHIAEHVKSLSFLALPGLDNEATEEEATEEGANKKKGRSVNFENSNKRLRNPGSPPQPPSGVTYVEDISLTFEDNDDEPESQVHKKPPQVVYIDPKYVTNQSAHDMNNTAETEVDRFFTSIPADEPDFSWGFIMPHDVPLSAVDSAFQKWPNHASTSAPRTEAPQDQGGEYGSALNAAAAEGVEDTVQFLIDKAAPLSYRDPDGRTPLYLAARNGHKNIVSLLLKRGADVTVADKGGWTPLYAASDKGHVEVVKVLLENGADVTVASTNRWTPLNTASDNGHFEVVKVLLENGADVTVTSTNGWTPLNAASDSGHVEVIKVLLENGADVIVANEDGWTPLYSASNNGHLEVVKVLLENGADVTVASTNGWTPLNAASNSGHVEVVKVLLENGADVTVANIDGWTPLYAASNKGYVEVVKVLLENGADVTVASEDK